MWDVHGKKPARRFRGASAGFGLALSPEAAAPLTVAETSLILWDVDSGKSFTGSQPQTELQERFAFSPDGTRFAVGSERASVRLLDVATGKQLAVFPRCKPRAVVFSGDGKRVFFGSRENGKSFLADLDLDTGSVRRFETVDDFRAESLALSLEGTRLLSNGPGKSPYLWDVNTGKELLPRTGHDGPLVGYGFQPDGKTLLSVGADMTIRKWDLTVPAPLERSRKRFSGANNMLISAALSPDGKTLAIGTYDREIQLWNVDGEMKLRTRLSTAPAFRNELLLPPTA